jgi:hypothetical protein
MNPMPAVMEEFPISDFFGKSTTHAGTGNDGRTLAQLVGPFDSGHGHRLTSRNDGKLREAIHEAKCFSGEVVFGVIAEHGGAVFETDLIHAHFRIRADVLRYRTYSRLTIDECLPELLLVKTQGADDAHS